MAHSYADVGGFGDFTVTATNPSSTIVRFTLSDAANRVTQIRLIQAILRDAVTQWLALNPTAVAANGGSLAPEARYPGDGYAGLVYNYGSKYCQVTLDTLYGIDATETLTVAIPYADVTG